MAFTKPNNIPNSPGVNPFPAFHSGQLFTVDGSGSGQLDARNQDDSANSKENPARPASVITVLMTGAGAMAPSISVGELGPLDPPFPVPLLLVSARVNYVAANVLYAAQSPGMLAGIVRVDIQIPSNTAPGDAVVTLSVGPGNASPRKTTVAVQ